MQIVYGYGKKCTICRLTGKNKDFDLPALVFNFLENCPIICEQCLYRILTNQHVEYRKEIEKYLKIED